MEHMGNVRTNMQQTPEAEELQAFVFNMCFRILRMLDFHVSFVVSPHKGLAAIPKGLVQSSEVSRSSMLGLAVIPSLRSRASTFKHHSL